MGWQDDPITETPAWQSNPVQDAPAHQDGVMDRFLHDTPIGRVMDAFGQGFNDGYDRSPVLSPETEKAIADARMDKSVVGPIRRAFNEAVFRPAASFMAGVMRTPNAVLTGLGEAAGQVVANETGLTQLMGRDENRAREEWGGAAQMSAMALGLANEFGVIAKPKPIGAAPATLEAESLALPKPTPKVMATAEGLEPTSRFVAPESSVLDKAGNINLSRIQAPNDVKDVIRQAAEEKHGFVDARRGTMSLAQTEQLADAMGVGPEWLLGRKTGQAFNAEEALTARDMLVQSATEVRNLAAKAAGGAEADLIAFQEAATKHTAIQEQVAGMTAEAGRALSSFRIMAGEEGGVAEVLKSFGGREGVEDMARKITELDTPQKVSKFLMDSRKATTGDMVIEAWINGLLSGPATHAVNTISNTVTALWNVPETAVAAGIGKLRGAAPGERVMLGEAGEELFGIVQGSKEGLIAAAKAFKDDGFVNGGQKIEIAKRNAIPSAKTTIFGREVELGGRQVRIPGRLLTASDEYFKAIGARQALNRLAYRQASKEGLAGDEHAARVAQLVENPTDTMRQYAREQAEYQTFTNPLGATGQALQKLQMSNKAARVVLTFIRTPINIAKYTVRDRTPLGLFSKEIRDNLASPDKVLRDTTAARLALGTAVGVTATSLAARGLITGGGPSDPRERAALYATGWQPYSVKIGDMYYSYGRVEPLATLLGLPADMYDKAKDVDTSEGGAEAMESAAGLMVASLFKNLASKTSLTGLTDLVQAVEDPDRYGRQYLEKLAASTVPNVLAQTSRMVDPYQRDAHGFLDRIQSRVPGASENVLPRLDIWGQPVPNQGGPGAITGIYASRISDDPVNRDLISLGIFPARPDRNIKGVRLDDDMYSEFQMTAGRLAKAQLDSLVANPGYHQMPDFARKEVIENTIRHSRRVAEGLMQVRHPELISKGIEARIRNIRGVAK